MNSAGSRPSVCLEPIFDVEENSSERSTLDNLRCKTQKEVPITLGELTGPLRNKHGLT